MASKKILVILTGGTIGSIAEGENVSVTKDSPYRLLKMYREIYGDRDEFEVIQPFTILSENMNMEFWSQLGRMMWEIPYEEYEGVILAHGSDTLSYTSAFLGILLRHVPVPVILVASNYPLGEKGSNGLVNFRSAVELIGTHQLKGVFTIYQNNKGENNVYLATRITEADAYLDQFGSFGGVPFGTMEKGELKLREDKVNPSLAQIKEPRACIAENCPCFEKPILMIRPYPGLDYRSFSLDFKPAAVLHYLYHSATACTLGDNTSLPQFMDLCQEKGIPFYTASSKKADGRNYVTAKEILQKGAIPMENISPEAAYAKLFILYNLERKDVEKKVKETIYFENLPFLSMPIS